MRPWYTRQAERNLASLDPETRKRIVKKIRFYVSNEESLQYATKLKNYEPETYRFRVGDYRILFRIRGEAVKILRIGHRSEIYD